MRIERQDIINLFVNKFFSQTITVYRPVENNLGNIEFPWLVSLQKMSQTLLK